MHHSISFCCALMFSTAVTAQPTERYATALAVILENADSADIYESSDGSGELTYKYEEAGTCNLESTTNILLTLSNGTVHTVSGSTLELHSADPDAITTGQTDAYGSFVEINTRFSAATVRSSNYSFETCTIYCTSGETLKTKFQIETDHPDEVAAAVKTMALACARD